MWYQYKELVDHIIEGNIHILAQVCFTVHSWHNIFI